MTIDTTSTRRHANSALLSPAIMESLDRIEIAADACSGSVDKEEVSAENYRDFQQLLSRALYARLHAGIENRPDVATSPQHRGDVDIQDAIERVTPFRFREQVATDFRPALELPQHPGAYFAIVDGLRVLVPANRILSVKSDTLRLSRATVNHRLSVGFTYYTSRQGRGEGRDLLRLYKAATSAEELIPCWQRIVSWGEKQGLAFRMKMLSEHDSYPRHDALVLYLAKDSWNAVGDIISMLEGTSDSGVSVYARPVAQGVGASWEPLDPSPYRRSISFGEHRSAAFARGLCLAQLAHLPIEDAIEAAFYTANIDPLHPYRNLNSPEVILP